MQEGRVVLALVVALVLNACAAGQNQMSTGGSPMNAIEPAPASLEGGEWVVVEHLDADGELVPIAEGIRANAVFADGRVAGNSGCNAFAGAYEADGDNLSIDQVATTQMACVPEIVPVERAVLGALDATIGYTIDDGSLSLTDADGQVVLLLEASPLTLVGADWGAIAINDGQGGVRSLVIGTSADATFGEDGQLAGFGGCNRVFGPYEVDGLSIRIGPLASGRMSCPEPEGVMEQEAAYLAALERATTWTIRDGRLQLRDADGALQVDYRPADEVPTSEQ